MPSRRTLETLGLAILLGFLPEFLRTRLGLVLQPHPGWFVVLFLAARDGGAGCLAGLFATAGAVALGASLDGTGPEATFERLASGPNLVACGACLIVSWVASWHLRRQAELGERVLVSSSRDSEARATITALRGAVLTLRARVDRAATSLSFLRDVATRLESHDPIAAAEGAADLAIARTGASAAVVKVGTDGFRRLLAVRDVRGSKVLEPLEVRDADLTVPIRDGSSPVGVIALWGLPAPGIDEATAHDLSVIASWCAPALAARVPRPESWPARARSAS